MTLQYILKHTLSPPEYGTNWIIFLHRDFQCMAAMLAAPKHSVQNMLERPIASVRTPDANVLEFAQTVHVHPVPHGFTIQRNL